jgi:hypothetical protein
MEANSTCINPMQLGAVAVEADCQYSDVLLEELGASESIGRSSAYEAIGVVP